MHERFVSEVLFPLKDAGTAQALEPGAPALPKAFRWGKETITLDQVLETWKETGPCSHGSREQYIRKHWYRVRTDQDQEMKIYFERQAQSKKERTRRWWLFTVSDGEKQ
jgi:phosphoribosylglycinamide formyltransferase-1